MARFPWAYSSAWLASLLVFACEGKLPDNGPPEGPDQAPLTCEQTVPGASPIRLLTRLQYDSAIADLFGDTSNPSQVLPPENEVGGFRNNAEANLATPLLVEQYYAAAEGVARRAVEGRLDEIAPCADADETQCGFDFVRRIGERVFRRPLDEAEALTFDTLFSNSLAAKGYAKSVQLVLQAMLQSPQFVYRVDAFGAPTEQTGAIPVTGYQMASRLSFFLINSTPDSELLMAAANAELETPAQVAAQARRLLSHPRASLTVLDFHQQWLELPRLVGAAREAVEVSVDPAVLVSGWQGSLQQFLDSVFWSEGTVQALFQSPAVFVNADLAPLYGVQPPAEGFVASDATGPRSGLLTQPALMALLAHSDQSAPVLRGAFVRDRIMCLPVPPPPPDVNAVPPDPDPNATTRERFRQHTENERCRSCHSMIDGIGFGFERYDQFGRYRAQENGFDVDESGQVNGTGDPELDGPYATAGELTERLANSSRVRDCVATQWYRYAMGRLEDGNDTCSLDQVKVAFAESGGNLHELLVAITQSDAFLYRPANGDAP